MPEEAPELIFESGCQWIGTFIKIAHHRHRRISFHLPTYVAVNCLAPDPAVPGLSVPFSSTTQRSKPHAAVPLRGSVKAHR